MSVYYKFKSSKVYSSMPVAGMYISVADLKQHVFESKGLGGTDYDLLVTNAQTMEDYDDEKMLISRNTSVILRRVPGLPRPQIVVPQEDWSRNADVSKITVVAKPDKKTNAVEALSWSKIGILPELLCPLCKIIMKDAVLPRKCCFRSFCHKCLRDHIISNKMCACGATKVDIDDLVPNNALRKVIISVSDLSSSDGSRKSNDLLHVKESSHYVLSEEPLLKYSLDTTGDFTRTIKADQRSVSLVKQGNKTACLSGRDFLMLSCMYKPPDLPKGSEGLSGVSNTTRSCVYTHSEICNQDGFNKSTSVAAALFLKKQEPVSNGAQRKRIRENPSALPTLAGLLKDENDEHEDPYQRMLLRNSVFGDNDDNRQAKRARAGKEEEEDKPMFSGVWTGATVGSTWNAHGRHG